MTMHISRRALGKSALAASALAAVPTLAGATAAEGASTTSTTPAGIALPKGTALRSLDVIPSANLTSNPDRVLVASLQGLVAKTSSEGIFIDEGGPGAIWKNFLHTTYGIALDDAYPTWQQLLTRFRRTVRGYIRYDLTANPASLNVASSLGGPMNALIVDVTQESAVQALGVTRMLLDVSDKDEHWAYSTYQTLFADHIAAELNPTVYYHLRDYIALTDSFTFYDGVTKWRAGVLGDLEPAATLMGYGNDETAMIQQASEEGVTSIPSDLAPNLSVLSGIHSTEGLSQKPEPAPATANKHYVTFVISDGDNVAFNLWGLQQYFANPVRGSFDVGFGISPSLVDLAPGPLRWYYENASAGPAWDNFIAGPSGRGYTYPSHMPADALDAHTVTLNEYMGKADLRICEILDDQPVFKRSDLWAPYLRQPNIDALFYFGPGVKGGIRWVNGKPVIAQRNVLWAGQTEEPDLIDAINKRPAAPGSADGYTLVLVHCWTKTLTDVQTVVNGLGPQAEVVTPRTFVRLINDNHAH
ncbi:GxGYxYP domain-containing protein [Streptomyces sp. NPDC006332]|uniref:GxGYxYP domain-containing protein n=1 Tax=Streptomyces sp. NPDC006332 TaxID=3155456 RepID=UPI0033B62B4E